MDIKEYISSGVIEAYVLGLASAEEVKEVEAYAVQYAEVREAISSFELALEREVTSAAIAPPAFLKEKILSSLHEEKEDKSLSNPVSATGNGQPKSTAKVVSINDAPKSIRWMRGAIAASIILLLGSIILNFYYYSQYKKYNQQYKSLVAEQSILLAKNDAYQARFDMMTDTAVIKVTMPAATEQRAGSAATVFWNKQTQDVYLTVNSLPKPVAGKQYQLWAIVDGKPVDAGMIDATTSNDNPVKMKKMHNAQAFAITLEKEGGSPAPDMNQLFVLGKV